MKPARWLLAAGVLLAAIYLLWPDERPNVLLITVDSLISILPYLTISY